MWADPEWPQSLKNALSEIWKMYKNILNDKVKAQTESYEEINDLLGEKDKVETKYATLLSDVRKWMVATEKSVIGSTSLITDYPRYASLMGKQKHICLCDNKHETKLKIDLQQLPFDLQFQKDSIMWEQIKASTERGDLEEDNEKLRYKISDLLKTGDLNKTKLKMIKFICDE